MEIQILTLTPYQSNCYLVRQDDTLIVIDPGQDAPALREALGQDVPDAVVCTHAHPDHVQGVPGLLADFDVPFYLHPAGQGLLRHLGVAIEAFTPLVEGQALEIGALRFDLMHVPGHSPDHVLLLHSQEKLAFVGDLVFAGSVGRVDLPGCDPAAMERSLRRLLALDGDLAIYPGHGPATTLARERWTNPFLIQLSG